MISLIHLYFICHLIKSLLGHEVEQIKWVVVFFFFLLIIIIIQPQACKSEHTLNLQPQNFKSEHLSLSHNLVLNFAN